MEKNKNLNNRPTSEEMKEVENLFKANELDALENKLKKMIDAYSRSAILFNILGIVYQKKGFFNEAITNFKKAINVNSTFYLAHNNLGNALKNANKIKESLISYQKAIKINPRYAEAYSNLGNALKELGKYDDSILNHKEAIKINPSYSEAFSNLGNVFFELADFEKAIEYHQKAIGVNPQYAEAYTNLGNAQSEQGKFQEAISNYKKSLKLNPQYKESILNESLIYLAQGKFESGWQGYEQRFYKMNITTMRYDFKKIWDGSYLDGTLLVWGEQGIGDHILFGSMINDLTKSAKDIILEVDNRLVNLFNNYFIKMNFLNVKAVTLNKEIHRKFDKHIAIGSLGQFLRKNKASFKNTPNKYLIASSKKTEELKKEHFKNKKLKIGISWKTLNKKQQFRNIPIEQMIPILSIPNCTFVNLQFGDTIEDLKLIKSKYKINIQNINEIDNYKDLEGLAALINCLDIVITIQNSTAHLSAALGKETWIMLTKNSRWHWTISEKKSLWYPSARLFQQEKLGNWNNVILDINDNLKKIQNNFY